MAVSSHKLGPGRLTIGEVGTETEFGTAIRSCILTPEAEDGDTLVVLSGDEVTDSGDETWTLEGTVLQSYDAKSLILWCNQNSGKTLPFTFIPSTEYGLNATGNVAIRSIALGGDVRERNTSDFSFKATSVVIAAELTE